MSADTPALQLADIAHTYGPTPALRGVDLRVETGEVVAITGPSGCGKSTLLHIAAGILRPVSGSVCLLGTELAPLGDAARTRLRRERVGIVLQFGQLVPDLSLRDNVALPLLLGGQHRDSARTTAEAWLERIGVNAPPTATPAQLSGGQAQRVAVARALVADPGLILADEPTGSMDSLGGEHLLELLLSAARKRGAAVVLVTHDNLVAARADREVRLRDGVVEAEALLR